MLIKFDDFLEGFDSIKNMLKIKCIMNLKQIMMIIMNM